MQNYNQPNDLYEQILKLISKVRGAEDQDAIVSCNKLIRKYYDYTDSDNDAVRILKLYFALHGRVSETLYIDYILRHEICIIGIEAYKKRWFQTAEEAFFYLYEIGSDAGTNNLVFMVRRGEITGKRIYDEKKLIQELVEVAKNNDSFAIVNFALMYLLPWGMTFAFGRKHEETDGSNVLLQKTQDWKIWLKAEKLISKIKTVDVQAVSDWWCYLGNTGDIEGYLVHLFLLDLGLINASALGSGYEIASIVKGVLPQLPRHFLV